MATRRAILRFVVKAIVFILLGAIVNVAVAAYIAIKPNQYEYALRDTGDNYAFDVFSGGRGSQTILLFPGEIFICESPGMNATSFLGTIDEERFFRVLPCWSRFCNRTELDAIYDKYIHGRCVYSYNEHATGWPLLAMRSRYIRAIYDSDNAPQIEEHTTESLGRPLRIGPLSRASEIPLRPIWPGFAINSALYGAAVWIVFAVPLAFRRWNRTRRGLCSKCKYPIGSSPVCTECGAAVRNPASRHDGKAV